MMAILIPSLLVAMLSTILMATVHSGQTLSMHSPLFPLPSTSFFQLFPSVVSPADLCTINNNTPNEEASELVCEMLAVSAGFPAAKGVKDAHKSLEYTYQVWTYCVSTIPGFIWKTKQNKKTDRSEGLRKKGEGRHWSTHFSSNLLTAWNWDPKPH